MELWRRASQALPDCGAVPLTGCKDGARFGIRPPAPTVPRTLSVLSSSDAPLKGRRFGVFDKVSANASEQCT